MRFKVLLLLAVLCAGILTVRANHEDYEDNEDNTNVEQNEDIIEIGTDDTEIVPAEEEAQEEEVGAAADVPEDSPPPDPPAAEETVEPEAEQDTEAEPVADTSVEEIIPQEELIKSKSGNLWMEDDFYYGNLDATDSNYDWNDPNNRVAPSEPKTNRNEGPRYVITTTRLMQIRRNFMYWFFDQGGNNDRGDYQTDIHASNPQLHKNFNFQLPFFGFRFNYTRVSVNGFLEFSDPPEHYTYPLTFPIKDWPRRNDPSFIGIFFSKCRIGRIYPTDIDQRTPGVYFRMERDLETRTDRFGVEVRERTMWDIREGVVGSDTFVPKHVVIVTWKNMSFSGGIDIALFRTNSFQMVLATDEVYTYAIFNYADLNWSSHTEAGGDTTGGEGGVPAFIGFNAGNGTQSYEYKPYSQASVLRDLTGRGWANGFPGRHIFRLDERIMLGTCNKDIDAAHLPLVFAPESGNMLGGTIVNITGPCFLPSDRISCRFDTEEVIGLYVDTNRVICVQPFLLAQGYIRFEISVGTEKYKWRGRYFVETPATATDRIFFDTEDVYRRNPAEIGIKWNRYNLTTNFNAGIRISLYGYRERTIRPQLEYISMIAEGLTNTGEYTIAPANFRAFDNPQHVDMQFGFLMINLTNPNTQHGREISPQLWSRPIPLAWYFGPQWERIHGRNWPRALCDNWLRTDRFLRNFPAEIPICPCILEHAVNDKGRFLPDFDCDRDSNPTCRHHRGAIHCVRTGQPSIQGSEQQCCYDRNGNLMMSHDQMWGSRPRRTHNIGQMPWNEANKVPTLSTWFHDIRPYYSCCYWQDEQAVGCETLRFERRPTQDCVGYQAPGVAGVFGDPHIVTFDNTQYTFNGMGEFVLVRSNTATARLNVQGRFERAPASMHGPTAATHLTSIVAQGNTTTKIEVRLRPAHAQWRYRLDVFANERRIYFDRQSLKFQHFDGVTVYTPTYILNQSEVVIMFASGAGVEVVENNGYMTCRVYLPWTFINQTRGLFGNWSFDMMDDFTSPEGNVVGVNVNNFDSIHREFGIRWMLSDRDQPYIGRALFTREFGRTSSHFANESFIPNFIREPRDFLPANRTHDVIRAEELCGSSYQCRFDYGMTVNRDMAHFTKNYFDSVVNIQDRNNRHILSCGIMPTPRFGRKSNFMFTPGSTVSFECNEGFFLIGDQRRVCGPDGRWEVPEYGYTECLREVFYTRRTAWITMGIILAVMVPLLMCIVCGVYCYRKKSLKQDPNYKLPISRSRSNSQSATFRHLNSDGSEMGGNGTLKKARSYDRVYRTNEPLEGKPNIEFSSDKKWDLDDGDVTSSEGDKPGRQMGRRAMEGGPQLAMLQDQDEDHQVESPTPGYSGIQQFPPPLLDSPSPDSYSPTSSGLDRNSFMNQQPQQQQQLRSAPMRPPSGAVQVLPSRNPTSPFGTTSTNPNDSFLPYSGPSSPTPITQNVGLPEANAKSTPV